MDFKWCKYVNEVCFMNDCVKNDFCFGIWQSRETNSFDVANVKYKLCP